MILVDMNQCMISNMMMQLKLDKVNSKPDISLVRPMIIRSLFSYRKISKNRVYGDTMVLCYDSKKYWREEVFPFYKKNRKKERKRSELDWNSIFSVLNEVRHEIEENLTFPVMEVDSCEADDIISVLSRQYNNQKNLIVSGDKDFAQLAAAYLHINQYDPIKKMSLLETRLSIVDHILKGDRSDGIPNILSPDNSIVDGIRQKPITKSFLEKHRSLDFGVLRQKYPNFSRNEMLINLEMIPADLEMNIRNEFVNASLRRRKVINYNYISQYKLNSII